ncbi:hypothetical protein HID58_068551 [Brassica napus]|uniref:Uncharacterized protein n=1 Tax=Brassica napus TaxID=3708 RepID=A0ABQ7ZLS2_BRANA|nr:hypothetical protein HID58_068551 [Brassica napus]
MIIYVSEVYWREGKVNKTKALILSPLKKKMSEKKQVFVSIASPNNLTPTSEKPVLYYGGSPTMALFHKYLFKVKDCHFILRNPWKTVEADMSGSIGLKPEQ